jgi:hypothetical protein
MSALYYPLANLPHSILINSSICGSWKLDGQDQHALHLTYSGSMTMFSEIRWTISDRKHLICESFFSFVHRLCLNITATLRKVKSKNKNWGIMTHHRQKATDFQKTLWCVMKQHDRCADALECCAMQGSRTWARDTGDTRPKCQHSAALHSYASVPHKGMQGQLESWETFRSTPVDELVSRPRVAQILTRGSGR